MNATRILDSIRHHIFPPSEYWRVTKRRPRVHPYDEMELPISSSAWLHLRANSLEEADRAVTMVVADGIAEFPNPNPNTVDLLHVAVFKIPTFSPN